MEVQTKVTKIVTLTLNEQESMWLRGVMQNPLHDIVPGEEHQFDKQMRKKFFEALSQNEPIKPTPNPIG